MINEFIDFLLTLNAFLGLLLLALLQILIWIGIFIGLLIISMMIIDDIRNPSIEE